MAETTQVAEKKMKLFFLRNATRHPVACVVTTRVDDETIRFAVSTHNPLDKFSKDKGKAIAIGRLAEGRHFTGTVKLTKDVKVRLLVLIAMSDYMPQRTREAAELWLANRPAAAQ